LQFDFLIDFQEFENVIANSYIPKITLPTRLNDTSGTLIDNFLVKISNYFSKTTAGILIKNISDHLPYFIVLDYLQIRNCTQKIVKLSRNDPGSIQNLKMYLKDCNIMEKFDLNDLNDPNENLEKLNSVLQTGLNIYLPTKTVKFQKYKFKKSPWVTAGILKSIRYRDKLYAQFKKTTQNDELYERRKINLKTYNCILKRSIRIAKTQYYHRCFDKFKFDSKKTWSTIKSILNKSKQVQEISKCFLVNNNLISDPQTISNEFNKFFTNIGPELANKITPPPNCSFKDFLDSPCNVPFRFKTVDENTVGKAIDQLKPKSSKSHDNISNKLLKAIKCEISKPLTFIINQSFNTGVFPASMKVAKVTPLFKKNDESIFDNYRPISILPSISKIFERLMHDQINEHFTNNNLFYNSQYGFRSLHSTEFAALELLDKIITQLDRGEIPINIYLDLSKAFDTIDYDILLHKLQYYGFDQSSLQLLKSYLFDRCQYVTYENCQSEKLNIQTGVPQGSILGPLLFIVYMNDMPKSSNLFYPIIYADDSTLLATLNTFEKENESIEDNINIELRNISNWMKLNRLSLNLSKTKAMLFHMPQKTVHFPKLSIDSIDIDFVKEFNFLGINFDENLNWKSHILKISTKISKVVGILNKLKHFLPKEILLVIYNSLIVPHLNYGALLWEKLSNRIFVLQKKAIRAVTNSKFNAHTDILFKNLNTLKCKDICALHGYKFCFKLEKGTLPTYFLSSFTKTSEIHRYGMRRNKFSIPVIRHDFAKCGIRYKISILFNNMVDIVKEKIYSHSFQGFKNYVKNRMIKDYPVECNIENCYICGNN